MSSKMKSSAEADGGAALVPKRRFPEFREAGAWSFVPMGTVYTFRGNNSLSRDKLNYSSGYFKNIHYGDIHTKFASHFDITKERVPFVNEEELGAVRNSSVCAEGDLILADASEDMKDIGKCIEIVNLNNERVVAGLHTILASPEKKNVNLGFGGHLFQSAAVRRQIQREAQGAKVLGISPRRLQDIGLLLPSLPEQQKIVDCLDSVDALIAAQGRTVEALKAHKKGLMQQLFPQEGETQPRLRFPEFEGAGEWEERHLESLAKRGSGHTPSKSNPEYYNGGIKWISLADSKRLDQGLILQTEVDISAEGIKNSSAVLHEVGSVLISRDAGIGKSAIMAIPMAVSQHFIVWTCNDRKLSKWFLYYFLQHSKPLFERAATGSTIKTIGLKFFIELRFRIPSRPEQQRIADCLTSLDDLIAAESQKLDTLKTHKKGLMQQLFPQVGEDDA